VDAINPTFQFCVYYDSKFIREAIYPEWATAQAPLILATAITYGRGVSFLSHRDALLNNHKQLLDRMAPVQEANIPFMYMGGLDPSVKGADPEFLGKSAVMSAEGTDGYWVFYEGAHYNTDHKDYFEWFTRANQAIVGGNFAFWREARETPDEYVTDTIIEPQTDKIQVGLFGTQRRIAQMLEATDKFEVHSPAGFSLQSLRQLDVVVLHNFHIALPKISRALRQYVRDGGGLLLAWDSAWFMVMHNPFPQIAVRAIPPTQNAEARLVVAQAHPAIGDLKAGTQFTPEFGRDYMIFKANPRGTTVIRNEFGDPVYVLGSYGKGRVCFSGSYYGYRKDLEGPEREAFLGIIDWLGASPQ